MPRPALAHYTPNSAPFPTAPSTVLAQTIALACPLPPDARGAGTLQEAFLTPTVR